MRIYEVVDNQLDEAYLAEVDWSKIKKGVATGVISLGLLGLSGLGNAAEITKMSDADVKAYVTQQLKKGNIDKSQVVQAVQKVDSVPAKSNTTKVDEPKPEVKKDGPKKTSTVNVEPQVKIGDQKGLSTFAIKGIRFGMTLNQVLEITKATEWDSAAYRADSDKRFRDYQIAYDAWVKGGQQGEKPELKSGDSSKHTKLTTNLYKVFDGFSIGGATSWIPDWNDEDKLAGMYLKIEPTEFRSWVEKLEKAYGKPQNIDSNMVSNKLNFKDLNQTVQWKVKDSTIVINKYDGKFSEGGIYIYSDAIQQDRLSKKQKQKEKDSKDF